MKPTKPEPSSVSKPGGGFLCCSICGHTWISGEWKQAEVASRASDQTWHCLACSSLEMARRAAHARKLSLRHVTKAFLQATAEWEGVSSNDVWCGTAPSQRDGG